MLVEALLENASRNAGKVAVRDPSRELTWARLVTLAKVVRRIVRRHTDCPRVGMMLPGTAAGLGTLLGMIWAKRTAIPLNFLLQPKELRAVVDDAGIDLILATIHFRKQLDELPVRTLYLEEMGIKWRFLRERLSPTPPPPGTNPDEPAVILYTSGTTGQPKGVCLSLNNLVSNTRATIDHFRLTSEAHLLGIVPSFHVFGLTVLNVLPIMLGAKVTFIPRFSPQATYQAVQEDNVTMLMGVPSMFGAIARLKEIEREAFRSLKIAASGGEPLPRAVYDLFQERTGLPLLEGYGLTETSPIISADQPWAHRPGTVGTVLPGIEVQVRDATGRPLPDPAEGELYVRGPLVMKGYYRKPEETAAVLDDDGWFRTGDLVRIDPDGYLTITGRAKDLIIVGGENVYPAEVENVLQEHPDVAEAAVVGRADDHRGEVVVAFVAPREGTDPDPTDLRTHCREHLAGFKVPREVRMVEALPRGPTGKVLKRELRSRLAS